MKTPIRLALLAVLFFPLNLEAAPRTSASVAGVKGYSSLAPVHGDTLLTVAVVVKVKPGWHVNAHRGLPEGFIPLTLSLAPGAPASLVDTRYPEGVKKALAGLPPFPVYQGSVTLFADLRLAEKLPLGPLSLPFELRVQACNDQMCLAPAKVQGGFPLRCAPLSEPVAPLHPEIFKNALASQAAPLSDNLIAGFFRDKGVLITFLLIFLGGLALNLTPCVYPMIPLTVSYFGGQRAERPGAVLAKALAYVVGISVTYSGLGVTAALTGRILGSTLQSPWVLGGISALLAALSLSMFGLYEIQAPGWLLNKVAGGQARGLLGAFGMGLVFGVVAAPCVDPFSIGLLTFVAAKADPFLGFVLFFTLSMGLGFPYLWLGFFSGEIQKLPRSGVWMVWVKKVFGMVLLGMPLYFLNPLMPRGLNHWLVTLYLAAAGILLGWVFSGGAVAAGFKGFQRVFGAGLAALGLAVFLLWPKPLELPFAAYDPSALAEAKQGGKPLLVDFSAAWCLPCHELDLKTFSDPRVRRALKGWVLLKADLTQYGSAPVEALKKQYGIMGVPTLVFVGRDGMEKKDLRAVGFVTPEELLGKVEADR